MWRRHLHSSVFTLTHVHATLPSSSSLLVNPSFSTMVFSQSRLLNRNWKIMRFKRYSKIPYMSPIIWFTFSASKFGLISRFRMEFFIWVACWLIICSEVYIMHCPCPCGPEFLELLIGSRGLIDSFILSFIEKGYATKWFRVIIAKRCS